MRQKLNKKAWMLGESLLSIIVNTALFAVKLWVSIASGSLAMAADAWHTLSDSISSVAVGLAAILAHKPADKEHPFGHGRYEPIITLFIGFFLAAIAVSFFKESIDALRNHEAGVLDRRVMIVLALSILAKEALARFSFWAGKKSGSQALRADGWHHRSDAASSVIILLGALVGGRFWQMDAILAFIVALIILYAAFDVVWQTVKSLLGSPLSEEEIVAIKAVGERVGLQGAEFHGFQLHDYGERRQAVFHVRMNGALPLAQAHEKATQLEKALRRELGIEATIHVEPLKKAVPH